MVNKTTLWYVVMFLSAIVLGAGGLYGYSARLGVGWTLFVFVVGIMLGAQMMKAMKFGHVYAHMEDEKLANTDEDADVKAEVSEA